MTLPPPSIYRSILNWFYGHENETPDRRWNLTHGFLLEMHGLTHDWGKSVQYVDVYVSGIPNLVDIPEEELLDKSKGDFLTKTLVVLQTSWFMFQCIARWIQHLPVTELEVITLAFALLNIGIYILWWNKPQNMHVAIPMARYMIPNPPEEEKGNTGGSAVQGTSSDPEKCEYLGGIGVSAEPYLGEGTRVPASHSRSQLTSLKCLQEGGRGKTEVEEKNVGEIGTVLGPGTSLGTTPVQKSRFPWSVVGATRRYTRRAWAVLRMVGIAFHPRHLRSLEFRNITEFLMGPIRPLMAMLYRVKFAPHTFYASVKGTESWKTNLPMCIISTLFGGLHLIPVWFSTFPSSPENILWEISAICITVVPFLLLCTWVLSVSPAIKKHKALRALADSLFGLVIVVGGLLYVIARLLLVVLAFTTLRDLPPSTYQNIAWTTFLPHFN